MMINIPNLPVNLPFFIFDIDNYLLITSPITPGDIADTKDIILTEQPIPGLNYHPVSSGGMGNRHISFDLKIINRDKIFGNVQLLKLFENLRQPVINLVSLFTKSAQNVPNPRVLFKYGTGSIPLIYFVKKCDFSHKQGWVNALGEPMYSDLTMELILDESHPLNRGEAVFRATSSYIGSALALASTVVSQVSNQRTY